MRAGMVLEALAGNFSISLLVIKLYAGFDQDVPVELGRLCRRVTIIQPPAAQKPGGESLSSLASRWIGPLAAYHRTPFDVVHVFRLATLSQARPILLNRASRAELHLDLDDIESTTHRRLAELYRSNGEMARAQFEESEARRCQTAEEEAFQQMDRIYVCSEHDQAQVESRSRARVCVLPNAVRFPASSPVSGVEQGFRFLFIGTLGYYPNEDAALYLCREIVPRIRQQISCLVGFDIVGIGASQKLRAIAGEAGVTVLGPVRSVDACYKSAAAVVVPLRAAGGTRIKILEAFSYQRPVVSTSIGAEGLAARDEQEILIADTPGVFAGACLRLMTNSGLREHLSKNAFDLASRSYSLDALRRVIAAL
jgi:glycosyltransferase involved in cell wall biosynthesis